MISLILPDGEIREYDTPVSGADIAADIGPGLAKAALAIRINNELKDLSSVVTDDCKISIVTIEDPDALELLRHDAAHIMAQAVQELFPGTQVTIGPVIENGFYFDFSRKEPFTKNDLKKIEKKMEEIVDRDEKTYREVWKRDDAIKHFSKIGEKYKAEIIKSIPSGEDIFN